MFASLSVTGPTHCTASPDHVQQPCCMRHVVLVANPVCAVAGSCASSLAGSFGSNVRVPLPGVPPSQVSQHRGPPHTVWTALTPGLARSASALRARVRFTCLCSSLGRMRALHLRCCEMLRNVLLLETTLPQHVTFPHMFRPPRCSDVITPRRHLVIMCRCSCSAAGR